MNEERYRITTGTGIPKPRYRRTSGKVNGGAGGIPPMPEGFTDEAAWDAIHWKFSGKGTLLDEAVIGWQLDNQERIKAAAEAKLKEINGEH